MFMYFALHNLNKVQCPANRYHLSVLVSQHIMALDLVGRMIYEYYHTTSVPYSKPPEETVRLFWEFSSEENSSYPSV